MRWYAYRCLACGTTFEDTDHRAHERFDCSECDGELVRDYRSEAVGVNIANLKDARS